MWPVEVATTSSAVLAPMASLLTPLPDSRTVAVLASATFFSTTSMPSPTVLTDSTITLPPPPTVAIDPSTTRPDR
jgi:hypothetical protein